MALPFFLAAMSNQTFLAMQLPLKLSHPLS